MAVHTKQDNTHNKKAQYRDLGINFRANRSNNTRNKTAQYRDGINFRDNRSNNTHNKRDTFYS